MDIYTHMAYFVAKLLHMRPNEILDEWCTPELIIAYGEYANEMADKNFREWKAVRPKGVESPARYIVRFVGVDELEVEDG